MWEVSYNGFHTRRQIHIRKAAIPKKYIEQIAGERSIRPTIYYHRQYHRVLVIVVGKISGDAPRMPHDEHRQLSEATAGPTMSSRYVCAVGMMKWECCCCCYYCSTYVRT